jgi:CheY-like chemotaxis protein
MPDTSLGIDDTFIGDTGTSSVFSRASERPRIIVEGSGIPLSPTERKRSRDELDFHPGPPLKRLANATRGGLRQSYPEAAYETPSASTSTDSMDTLLMGYPSPSHHLGATTPPSFPASAAGSEIFAAVLSPTHRHLVMRDFMHELVDEALRACHPVTKHTAITERGEIIKVQTESPRGEIGNMSIEVDIEPDVPDHIVAEQAHLQFALQKVVDNALKFTENGNISLSVKLARNSQLLEIRVTDTGCGMTEDSKAHLFKPHFQEDASISRMKDGLGLSLFNAKAHVRKNLGGDMTLERSVMEGPLKGSEFLIRLPLFAITDGVGPETPLLGTPIIRAQRLGSPMPTSKTMAESVTQPFTPKSASKRPSPTMPLLSPKTCKAPKKQGFNRDLAKEIPLTVMVAEDNSINRNILVGYLKKLGYSPENIIVAFDGVEAVKEYENSLLRPTAQHIDAILMDLWMPNMNGYVATEQILKIAKERGESLAVMAVTADITSESLERAKQTGMKGFMSKPYKVLDVERLLIEHFGVDVQCTQGSYSG